MWPDVCWTWVGGRESWKGTHLLPFPTPNYLESSEGEEGAPLPGASVGVYSKKNANRQKSLQAKRGHLSIEQID